MTIHNASWRSTALPGHDTPGDRAAPITPFHSRASHDRAFGALALDERLFAAPFVLVGPDNAAVGSCAELDEARAALTRGSHVATLVGQLAAGVLAADIDPSDRGADPEAGDAVAEELIAWCERHGLGWLLRASGRPGGRHVLAKVPETLGEEYRALAARLNEHHGVAVTVRTSLRLLGAPHRAGLPAPILDGTLGPEDLPAVSPASSRLVAGTVGRDNRRIPGGSRSEREFGLTCCAVRNGLDADQAWRLIDQAGSKARDRGRAWWQAHMWLPAMTYVAAEQGLDDDEAWKRISATSPSAAQLGRLRWSRHYWRKAVREAATARPRRRHLAPAPEPRADRFAVPDERVDDVERMRAALHKIAEDSMEQTHTRPQRRRSVLAALDALAPVLVAAEGSISSRTWAERARLSRSVLMQLVPQLEAWGVLQRPRRYSGGARDCDTYAPGKPVEALLAETRTTRWYTPAAPPTHGHANPTRLRRHHHHEQRAWQLRCTLAEVATHTGERFAEMTGAAATTLRSLWHQRRWWTSLTATEQDDRRRARRVVLGGLSRAERAAWFDWLAVRDQLVSAAERVAAGRPADRDERVLAEASLTVHLGMRDPRWRVGGTPRRITADLGTGQLEFVA